MRSGKEKLLRQLTRTFTKGAWHGPTVLEVLEDVTTEAAQKRLPDSHSIIELVAHMTTWRNFVISRLEGKDFNVTDEMNFPAATDWSVVLEALKESQEKLLKAVEAFEESRYEELVSHASHKYTFYTMLHGIIQHDLYHIGQIVLLKKLK
jgi:uncharacterized damage-inducible protein DinB